MKQAKALRNHNTGRGCGGRSGVAILYFCYGTDSVCCRKRRRCIGCENNEYVHCVWDYDCPAPVFVRRLLRPCASKKIWLRMICGSVAFEFLSVSYIASGLLLPMLYGMMQDYGIWPGLPETDPLQAASGESKKGVAVPAAKEESAEGAAAAGAASGREGAAALPDERIAQIMAGWPAVSMLTAREAEVLRALLENKNEKISRRI